MFAHAAGKQHGDHVEMGGEMTIKHGSGGEIIITHRPDGAPTASMGDEPPAHGAAAKVVASKAKAVALTAVGAAGGFVVAGPAGAIIGASVGGLIDYLRAHKPVARPGVGPAADDLPPNVVHLKPIAVASLTKTAPGIPKLRLIRMAATAKGAADPAQSPSPAMTAAKQAADALYGYFKQYPFDRQLGGIFWQSPKTGTLVKAFQTAFNADTITNAAIGQLSVNGFYDSKTAGALTFYTHDPVDPDPNAG